MPDFLPVAGLILAVVLVVVVLRKVSERLLLARLEDEAFLREEHLAQACRERFLRESLMSALEWERVRDRVIVVMDDMEPEEALSYLTEEPGQLEALLRQAENGEHSGREVFRKANESLSADRRLQKLGHVSQPAPADLYLARE